MKPEDIKNVVVIGTGMMGPGITYTLASVGRDVIILARSSQSMEKGLKACREIVRTLVAERIVPEAAGAEAMARINPAMSPIIAFCLTFEGSLDAICASSRS